MAKRAESATVQVGLRLKERLRGKLAALAKYYGRSLNSEIERRLEMSLVAEREAILTYRGRWLRVLRLEGKLWLVLPGENPEWDEDLVEMKIADDDLTRVRNFITGAPYPYNMSVRELEEWLAKQEAEMTDEDGEPTKRGK